MHLFSDIQLQISERQFLINRRGICVSGVPCGPTHVPYVDNSSESKEIQKIKLKNWNWTNLKVKMNKLKTSKSRKDGHGVLKLPKNARRFELIVSHPEFPESGILCGPIHDPYIEDSSGIKKVGEIKFKKWNRTNIKGKMNKLKRSKIKDY